MWPDGVSGATIILTLIRWLKWLLILMLYSAIIKSEPLIGTIVLILLMAMGYLAYDADLKRESMSSDDFTRDGLFYRYGEEVSRSIFPTPIPRKLQASKSQEIADSLRRKLAVKLQASIPEEAVQILEPIRIRSIDRGHQKTFMRILSKTRQGSTIVHFFHFTAFAETLTIHLSSFARGTHGWRDIFKFVVSTPLAIWLWGIPWLTNRFSIISSMSGFAKDSYDDMDLSTIYVSSYSMTLEVIQDLLAEEGLLTPELNTMINQNIVNVQNFKISNSAGVSIGRVTQLNKATRAA